MDRNIMQHLTLDAIISSSSSSSDDSEDDHENQDAELIDQIFKPSRRVKTTDYIGAISRMDHNTFKSHFRLTSRTLEVIRNEVGPRYIRRNRGGGHPNICGDTAILLTIWLLANQESFRGVCDRFNTSESTAHFYFIQTCHCICDISDRYLYWPNPDEFIRLRPEFRDLRQGRSFPNVVGVVGGKHIVIPAPKEDPMSYYNRKGYHSINLQAIFDAKMRFLDAFVGWPGSTHDGRVWRESPIARALAENAGLIPEGTHILGDTAYPLLDYLPTPFRDNGHLTRRQRNYNAKLSSKRVIIEQAFGLLVSRVRRLKYLHMYLMNQIPVVVTAACVLHNLCINYNDEIEVVEHLDEHDIADNQDNVIIGGAVDKRNSIADLIF